MSRRKQSGSETSGSQRSGQALVEFAMVLPLLALMLFGIIQFGFIFAAYMTIRNATVVAARYAVLATTNTPTIAQIQNVAKQAVTPMLKVSNVIAVNVDTNVTVGAANGATSVQIQYNQPLLIPFVVSGKTAGSTLTLSATTIMR
jgi:Flp pilus assembly protein TadG